MAESPRICIRLEDGLLEDVTTLAADAERCLSDEVRLALRFWIATRSMARAKQLVDAGSSDPRIPTVLEDATRELAAVAGEALHDPHAVPAINARLAKAQVASLN